MDSNLFSNFDAFSIAYVNYEGIELPLNNAKDFHEAITSAKWEGKNHLDLIFYDHKLKANDAAALNNKKFTIVGRFTKSQKVPMFDADVTSNSSSQCIEVSFPELLKQYMKKFKKEILKDLRTTVKEMVQEEFEKRKKLDEAKLFKPFSHKNEFSSPKKFKIKKKISDKEGFDLLERGDTKLLRKIEKLHSSKFDKMMVSDSHLEKLVNRSRTFPDEKRKLLEKIHQIKLREAKKSWEHAKKFMKNEKSAVFYKNDVFLFLQPGEEFSVTVNILNNGTVPWVSPHMECFKTSAVLLQEPIIELPRLKPGQNVNVTLRGKVSESLGNYYFAYKLSDGLEEFGPLFWCFPIVSDSKKEVTSNSSGQPRPEKITFSTEGLRDTKMNSDKDMVEKSQKKIKENMIEIERSLRDLHLIKFCNESGEGSLNNNTGNFEVRSCNLLQDKEKKCSVENLEGQGISGVYPLHQQEETEKTKITDGNIKSKNFHTNKYGKDSDSDSDLSVIFNAEEDEDFNFVPCNCKCSHSETSNSPTKLPKFDLNKEFNEANQKPKKDVDSCPAKVELKEVGSKESSISKNCSSSRSISKEKRFSTEAEPSVESFFSFARANESQKSRRVISDESAKRNIPGEVPFNSFKGDSPRGNSRFNTVSKETPVSHSTEELWFSRNAKSEDKTNDVQNAFKPSRDTKTNNNARKNHRIKVQTTDCLGRPIYAVKEDGCCLPAEILHSNNEDPANFLYNLYPMGAEERQYIEELQNMDQYIDSMLTLREMGFVNDDLNFRLLKKHDSDFIKVQHEILDMLHRRANK